MRNLHSVQVRLTALVLLLALVPMVTVGVFLMDLSRNEISRELQRSTEAALAQAVRTSESLLKSAEQAVGQLGVNRKLMEALRLLGGRWSSDWNSYTMLRSVYDTLSNTAEQGKAETIILYDHANSKVYSSFDWGDQGWLESYRSGFFPDNAEAYGCWTIANSPRKRSNDQPSLVYFKRINDQFSAAALISVASMQETLEQGISRSGGIFLVDDSGTPAEGQDVVLLDGSSIAVIENSPDWVVCRTVGTRGDWQYVAVQSADLIIGVQIRSLQQTVIMLMLAMAAISIPLVLLLSRSIQGPVRIILDAMSRVQQGDLKAHITETRKDEFGLIYSRFNFMVDQMELMIDRLYRRRIEQQVAEIKTLQSQIKPHFLYNTLDTVHWMARMNRTKEIGDITFALCRFYRLVLSEGEYVVPAREALNLAGEYLKIQQLRYNNRFTAVFDVEPALDKVMVPKLLFQPLVENALLHGIDSKTSACMIKVTGRLEGDQAVFSVWDDGMGVKPERLEEIRSLISSEETRDLFALRNLYNQMRLLTGGEIEMTVDSQYGEWTCITLRFSADTGKDGEYVPLADR